MNKGFIKFISIILFLIFPAIAGNSLHAIEYPYADTNSIQAQSIDDTYFETLRSDSEFDYGGEYSKAKPNTFISRISQFFKKIFRELSSVFRVLPVLVQIIFWGLAIFFLVILITKTKLNQIFYSAKRIKEPDYDVQDTTENITDFDKAIQIELLNKQFRKAVRLLYLKIINSLKQLELINYSKEKTNVDYFNELRDIKIKASFSNLTGIYNNVWYGLFDIDEMQYQKYELNFLEFLNTINVKK